MAITWTSIGNNVKIDDTHITEMRSEIQTNRDTLDNTQSALAQIDAAVDFSANAGAGLRVNDGGDGMDIFTIISAFTSLSDVTPNNYTGANGKLVGVVGTALDFVDYVKTFNALTDTPTLTGNGGKGFLINSAGTALELASFVKLMAAQTEGQFDKTTTAPVGTERMNYDGHLYATRVYNPYYSDYAEYFPKAFVEEDIQEGDIICKIPNKDGYGKYKQFATRQVRGVVSKQYGHIIGGDGEEDVEDRYIPVALVGRVPVKILGPCKEGQFVVNSEHLHGVGVGIDQFIPGSVVGILEESNDNPEIKLVQMFVKNL